jgi:hypothetical protein
MARHPLLEAVRPLRQLVESLGPPIVYRKLHGILKALEMQVEDGHYQRHAVARLCEALLATAELYDIPEAVAGRLEESACRVIDVAEQRR